MPVRDGDSWTEDGDPSVEDDQAPKSVYLEKSIICDILRHLPLEEVYLMRCLCRAWREAANRLLNKCTKVALFDNSAMRYDYIYRKSHLYNLEKSCPYYSDLRDKSVIPNQQSRSLKTRQLVAYSPNIVSLVLGSPWFYRRDPIFDNLRLKSLSMYVEKQSEMQLANLCKSIEKLSLLKKLVLFNVSNCEFTVPMLHGILSRLVKFGLFNYKHPNVDNILHLLNDEHLRQLVLENVHRVSLPMLNNLQNFTYGWTENRDDRETQLDYILERIPHQFPNLESFTLATKYDIDIFDKIMRSDIQGMRTLKTLKLNITYEKYHDSTGQPGFELQMPGIETLHLYLIPLARIQNDFFTRIQQMFPSLKTFNIHSPQHPISEEEIDRIKEHFKDIQIQVYIHPIA